MKKYFLLFLLSTKVFGMDEVYFQGGGLQNKDAPNTTWTLQSGFISKFENNVGIGFSYLNEGHSENNHRDGFALQGFYENQITTNTKYQIGIGPYISNNNTIENQNRLNDFQLGLITSATIKYYLLDALYLRLQYNNILMTTSNSNSVLVGVGYDFSNESITYTPNNFNVSVWTGTSRTTQIGTQENATSFMFDVKKSLKDNFSFSVGLLKEGNTMLSNRTGGYIQGWYDFKLLNTWTLSGGFGPYLANNDHREFDQTKTMMIGSIRAVKDFKNFNVGFTFNRITSFYNRDQDLFMLGVGRRF